MSRVPDVPARAEAHRQMVCVPAPIGARYIWHTKHADYFEDQPDWHASDGPEAR